MKIFLSLEEMKTVRDALYSKRSALHSQVESEKESLNHKILEICEEGSAELDKLISYFNEEIRKVK